MKKIAQALRELFCPHLWIALRWHEIIGGYSGLHVGRLEVECADCGKRKTVTVQMPCARYWGPDHAEK